MSVVKIRNDADDAWIVVGGGITVVQQAGAPGTTYPGMLWVDTDAENPGNSIIEDDDNDTYITCEESADEDVVRIYVKGENQAYFSDNNHGLIAGPAGACNLAMFSDAFEANADYWRIRANPVPNTLVIQNYATGSMVDLIKFTTDGEVTMPLQPSFLAGGVSPAQDNIALGSWHIVNVNEIYDIGGNFASHAFTAPVDGKYLFNLKVTMLDFASDCTYYSLRLLASNRTIWAIMPNSDFDDNEDYVSFSFSTLVDMDVDDTVTMGFRQTAGTQQTDLYNDGGLTTFSGHLVG